MNSTLQTWALYAQIISPLAIVVSCVIYLSQKSKERKEKSIQIGMEIEDIVVLIAYINMTLELESHSLVTILHKANRKKMRRFESREIREVYTEEDLKEIKKYFMNNVYTFYAVGASPQIFKTSTENLLVVRKRYYNLFDKDIEEIAPENLDDFLAFEFQQMIVKTLNKLETSCMMMMKKIADERAVYNSMEDIFLEFVARFYYYIATINTDLYGADKKLKNVIKIFNKWERRSERERKFREINPYYW